MPNCVVRTATEPLTAIDANHPPLEVDVRRIAPLDFVPYFDVTRHDFRNADYSVLHAAFLFRDW